MTGVQTCALPISDIILHNTRLPSDLLKGAFNSSKNITEWFPIPLAIASPKDGLVNWMFENIAGVIGPDKLSDIIALTCPTGSVAALRSMRPCPYISPSS